MLRLVSNNELNPETGQQCQKTIGPNTRAAFSAEVHLKSPNLYLMTAKDPSHYLECEIFLEVEESSLEYEGGTVICHFPNISDDKMNDFINDDDTLYGVLLIQFQMKIMEQLLLFCANHYASNLIIYADDAQAEELGIFQDFLAQKDQIISENGEKTELIISSHRKTFDAWLDFMDEVNLKFHQTLWRDQRDNLTIRQYLKSHPFFKEN